LRCAIMLCNAQRTSEKCLHLNSLQSSDLTITLSSFTTPWFTYLLRTKWHKYVLSIWSFITLKNLIYFSLFQD
jgi:hypothetical protein